MKQACSNQNARKNPGRRANLKIKAICGRQLSSQFQQSLCACLLFTASAPEYKGNAPAPLTCSLPFDASVSQQKQRNVSLKTIAFMAFLHLLISRRSPPCSQQQHVLRMGFVHDNISQQGNEGNRFLAISYQPHRPLGTWASNTE